MSVSKDNVLQTTQQVDKAHPLRFSMAIGSATKNPMLFYGANFMEEINLSEIAHGLDGITLDGMYSDVLGSPLKRLIVGIQISENTNEQVDAEYTGTLASLGCQIQGNANVFQSLQKLDIRGQVNQKSLNTFVYNNNITELQEILAMGSGITDLYSSQSGNTFTNIEVPDTVYTIWMNNSTWDNITFWHTTASDTNIADILAERGLTPGSDAYYDAIEQIAAEQPELLESKAYFKRLSTIPTTVHNVSLLGTTGSTLKSVQFVKAWLASLQANNVDFSQYNLIMDKVNWSDTTVGSENLLTYDELALIAQLGNQTSLKGYIVLMNTGTDLTSAQLNNIKSWFGDTVFTKNSSGLVVDHRRQYIQINVGGDVEIGPNGSVTLYEGKTASLNATRFSLAEDDTTQYAWAVGPVGSSESYGRYNGLTVIQQADSLDGIARIISSQSKLGQDYDVQVTCSVEGVNYSTVIHVIAATYPTDMKIKVTAAGSLTIPRSVDNYIEFYQSGQAANLVLSSDENYTGVINKITYTLTRLSDNRTVEYVAGGSGEGLSNLHDDYIVV